MPAYFNNADVGRIVTGKKQHTHFVCEHMSAGSITCSALKIDGQPSQINVAGMLNVVAGTVLGSLGSYSVVNCNQLAVTGPASISSQFLAASISSTWGNVQYLTTSSITTTNMISQSVTTGLLIGQMVQSNFITTNNLAVIGSASSGTFTSNVINSIMGNFSTVTGTTCIISGRVSAGTINSSLGSFLSFTTSTVSTTSLVVSGNASLTGNLSATSITAISCSIGTLAGNFGTFTTSLFTGTITSLNSILGSMSATNLTVSGNASVTNSISATSITSSSVQSNSITATFLSSINSVSSSTVTANFVSVATLSASMITGSNLKITGSNVVNFGSDQTKATNSGRIGYQLASTGALDVFGAGTVTGSRNISLWDNVSVVGTFTTANIVLNGKITSPSFIPSWTSVGTFLNNWSAYVGQTPPGFWKDPFGIVHFRGLVRNTTASTGACFVLPAGYLPVNYAYFACSDSNAGTNSITVCINSAASGTVSAGTVTIATSTLTVSLDGITFATN